MKLRPIHVECYSGGRADEMPRLVVVDGREHSITRLLASSIEESELRERVARFTLLTDRGVTIEILRLESGDWRLVSMDA